MVIQLRGTSGSGKTWIINKLMEKYTFVPVKVHGKIFGYKCKEINLFIPGKYETACGGCDAISTQDEICRRIKIGVKNKYNVLFEGLICSHISQRYAQLYLELKKASIETYFIFLNTPLATCRENINKRRAKAGKPPTNAKNTEKDYISTRKSRKNMKNLGVPIENMPVLSSESAYEKILCLIDDDYPF